MLKYSFLLKINFVKEFIMSINSSNVGEVLNSSFKSAYVLLTFIFV